MIEQRSEAWFEQRKGKITGSAIGAILGLSPFAKPKDILRRMVRDYHGVESEFKGNIATEYGTMNEPLATKDLELLLGGDIQETGFHQASEWLGASPDGLFLDDYIIEIKCPFGRRNDKDILNFKKLDQQEHYYAQVQFEMYCAKRTKAYFYQWTPNGAEMLEEILLDTGFIEDSLVELKKFHKLYLKEINNKDHLLPEKKQLDDIASVALADSYKKLLAEEKQIKEKKQEILNKLVYISGGKDAQVYGMNLTHVVKKGAISYAKAIKDLAPDADLEAYRGKISEYWMLK